MRINLFGGPCAGKSRTAALIYSQLKDRGLSVEYAQEFVKAAAYRGDKFYPFDQIHFFGAQLHLEYQYLTAGVKNIVTDSPVILSAVYCPENLRSSFQHLYWAYDAVHPSINIFLDRRDKEYQIEGRFQTLEQAKELDEKIRLLLVGNNIEFKTFLYHERHAILDYILTKVDR